MLGKANRVSLNAPKEFFGEDQALALNRGQVVELDGHTAITILLDRENVPPESPTIPNQASQAAQKPLRLVAVEGHHLNYDRSLMIVLFDEHGQRAGGLVDQKQGSFDA